MVPRLLRNSPLKEPMKRPLNIADALEALLSDPEFNERAMRADALYESITRTRWSSDPRVYFEQKRDLEALDAELREALQRLGLTTLSLLRRQTEADDPLYLDPHTDDDVLDSDDLDSDDLDGDDLDGHLPIAPALDCADDSASSPAPAAERALPLAPSAPPARITAEVIQQLNSTLKANVESEPPQQQPAGYDELAKLKSRVGSIRSSFDDQNAIDSERGFLRSLTADKEMSRWPRFPQHIQVALVELLAARARTLQHEVDLHEDETLRDVFSALSSYCREHEPGFAYGLARAHGPQLGSNWRQDAESRQSRFQEFITDLLPEDEAPFMSPGQAQRAVEHLLDQGLDDAGLRDALIDLVDKGLEPDTRIARLLCEYLDILETPELRALRRAVKDQQKSDSEAAALDDRLPDHESWPLGHLTRDKNAVIVGGDPREDVRARLEAQLGFESLEWIPGNKGARRIQALAEKVELGSVDIVFVLIDFVRHAVTDRLKPGIGQGMVVHVPSGYGIARLKRGLEQAATRQRRE